jgi:histidinol dehydrogenase
MTQGAIVGERFDPLNAWVSTCRAGRTPLVFNRGNDRHPRARCDDCPEIVAGTPCDREGRVNPALVFALRQAGTTEIYGWVGRKRSRQLAYGTENHPPRAKDLRPGQSLGGGGQTPGFRASKPLISCPARRRFSCWRTPPPTLPGSPRTSSHRRSNGTARSILFVTDSARLLGAVEPKYKRQAATLSRRDY